MKVKKDKSQMFKLNKETVVSMGTDTIQFKMTFPTQAVKKPTSDNKKTLGFTCSCCNKSFLKLHKLKEHIAMGHTDSPGGYQHFKKTVPRGTKQCNECPQVFKRGVAALFSHKVSKHGLRSDEPDVQIETREIPEEGRILKRAFTKRSCQDLKSGKTKSGRRQKQQEVKDINTKKDMDELEVKQDEEKMKDTNTKKDVDELEVKQDEEKMRDHEEYWAPWKKEIARRYKLERDDKKQKEKVEETSATLLSNAKSNKTEQKTPAKLQGQGLVPEEIGLYEQIRNRNIKEKNMLLASLGFNTDVGKVIKKTVKRKLVENRSKEEGSRKSSRISDKAVSYGAGKIQVDQLLTKSSSPLKLLQEGQGDKIEPDDLNWSFDMLLLEGQSEHKDKMEQSKQMVHEDQQGVHEDQQGVPENQQRVHENQPGVHKDRKLQLQGGKNQQTEQLVSQDTSDLLAVTSSTPSTPSTSSTISIPFTACTHPALSTSSKSTVL